MTINSTNVPESIDHLFRHEYGKMVAVLTKTFSSSNIQLAEDVVQEAMLEAVNQWSYKGIPNNPAGWLYKVARYKALNILKREKYKSDVHSEQILSDQYEPESTIFTDKEIADDQLRMMFTCCHPSISPDSQVALTLKTLCGFSISEIASAFLTSNDNINKKLVRARSKIREADVPFEVPVGKDLSQRLMSVLETVYLLFNEGYHSSSGTDLIRFELCEEAIRLAEIIASNSKLIPTSSVYALLALMSLNAARFNSRIDNFDNIIDLEHQDRDKWDRELILKGLAYLDRSLHPREVSVYHILAAISAHHCTAKSFKDTDWENILSLYDSLAEIDSSPIVLLNRAIVISKITNAQYALLEIDKIKAKTSLRAYLPYYTSKAELYYQNNEPMKAITLLKKALPLTQNEKSRSFVINKIAEYEG
ncbi:MAG: RNA polymerase sigma factor [Calditrichia bacterium]